MAHFRLDCRHISFAIPSSFLPSTPQAVEHPLFCVIVLLVLQVVLQLLALLTIVKKKLLPHLLQRIVVSIWLLVAVSVLQAVLVEPNADIDQAMHTYEGRLPDIVIYEDEEPVDVLLKWGKEASKEHHPIVREPIYWELLDELCNKTEGLTCSRMRAWEFLVSLFLLKCPRASRLHDQLTSPFPPRTFKEHGIHDVLWSRVPN